MGMNIGSMGALAQTIALDSDYQRIIRELRALGIEPTGNKSVDKAKLEAAKAEQKAKNDGNVIFQAVTGTKETPKADGISSQDNIKNDTAIQAQNMTGADQIAQYNKYKLLGIY